MFRITNRLIAIDETIDSSARANPFIHLLPLSFSILAEVICPFIRRQSRTKHPDPMLMRAIDQLLQPKDYLLRCYFLRCERARQRSCPLLRRTRFHVRPPDVVNPFENHHVGDTGRCEYITVKPCQSTHPSSVMPDAISSDPFIDDCQARRSRSFSHASCELIGPIAVFALLRSNSIGDRISESYESCRLVRG